VSFDATIRKSESPEQAVREAKLSSYEGAKVRLRNAAKRLRDAEREYRAAQAEVTTLAGEIRGH
jgi:hypothetical protein